MINWSICLYLMIDSSIISAICSYPCNLRCYTVSPIGGGSGGHCTLTNQHFMRIDLPWSWRYLGKCCWEFARTATIGCHAYLPSPIAFFGFGVDLGTWGCNCNPVTPPKRIVLIVWTMEWVCLIQNCRKSPMVKMNWRSLSTASLVGRCSPWIRS